MKRELFNKNWSYNLGSSTQMEMNSREMTNVNLPHDSVILEEHDLVGVNKHRTGYYPSFNCNYTKEFFVDSSEKGSEIYFEFEGVYMNAAVYINNSFAGKCPNGYSNFYIRATDFIDYGETNVIKVVVKNEQRSTRWYSGGGIYRNVNIIKGDTLHIKIDGVKVTTESIGENLAVMRIDMELDNTYGHKRRVYVNNKILDGNKVVATGRSTVAVLSGQTLKMSQRIVVENAKLWDIDNPNMYTLKTTIVENEVEIDQNILTFGIRTLTLDRVRGLLINGKRVMLRGGCIHHDNGIIGAIEFASVAERKIKKLKDAGYNAIRSAHNPISKQTLDACDKYGMLVMDELADSWNKPSVDFDAGHYFSEWWEHDVVNMVNKDYNHPSVILYSIGNEVPDAGSHMDADWGSKVVSKIKELDPNRYTLISVSHFIALSSAKQTTLGALFGGQGQAQSSSSQVTDVNTVANSMKDIIAKLTNSPIGAIMTEEVFSYVDIAGYNYAEPRYDSELMQYNNRIIVGSETYLKDLDVNWAHVVSTPAILGDFVWTAWDYIGEAGIGTTRYVVDEKGYGLYSDTEFCLTAGCGDLDLIGDRRTCSYWRQSIWGKLHKPHFAVYNPAHYGEKPYDTAWGWSDTVESWSFSGYEGKPILVDVYTDCDEAELFINDVSCGRKKVGQNKKNIAQFDCIYNAGSLSVVTYNNGKQAGQNSLSTVVSDLRVIAQCNQQTLGHNDVSLIEISIADGNGVLDVGFNKKVKIEVEGAAVLQGFGSANPFSSENFFDRERTPYNGRLLAAVRSGYTDGQVKVTLTAEGLTSQTININVANK